MIFIILCFRKWFFMNEPWFLHTWFLIYDFRWLSDLSPVSLKRMSGFWGTV